ncbi:copper-binding protein, partial [Vibrio parahaemolyticus]
ELSWPAMTMGFTAKDGQLGGLKVGDKVKFTFRWDGKTAEIESIDKL